MTDKYTDLLVVSRPEFSQSLRRLMDDLLTDRTISTRLSHDPFGTISSYFSDTIGTPNVQQLSDANRLIFSVLANDDFRTWVEDFNRTLSERFDLSSPPSLDKVAIRKEVAEALLRHGDKDIVSALLSTPSPSVGCLPKCRPSPFSNTNMGDVAVLVVAVVAVHVVTISIDFFGRAVGNRHESVIQESSSANIRAIADQLVQAAKDFRDADPK